MSLLRREKSGDATPGKVKPLARPHPGLLRRERRALMAARETRLRDLGGLVLEMYRRHSWRDDLVHERCADIVGIDARLAEIDGYLHGHDPSTLCTCGAAILASAHFCPNCGRPLDERPTDRRLEDTMMAAPSFLDDAE